MPIYTYQCQSCSAIAEKRQSFSDAPLTTCEQCRGSVRRLIHPVGIVFKGSGWYVTDSRASTKNGASADAPKKDETKPDAAAKDGSGPTADAGARAERVPAADGKPTPAKPTPAKPASAPARPSAE